MQLIAVEQSGAVAEFVLKNVSSGTITAFTVTHGGVGHTIDYFQADGDLQPGATYSLKVASEEVSGSDHILNVTCVVFADGKAEGTPDGIDFIKGRRLGRLFEVERVKAILEGQTDTLPVEAGLEAFNAKIGSLPASAAEALQSVESVRVPEANLADIRASGSRVMDGFMLGVRNARQDALWKVKQYTQAKNLRLPPGASPHTLSDLRQFYRGLTTKYHVQLGSRKDGVR
jgi:hypothetical protein